jgi:hypothetical protein
MHDEAVEVNLAASSDLLASTAISNSQQRGAQYVLAGRKAEHRLAVNISSIIKTLIFNVIEFRSEREREDNVGGGTSDAGGCFSQSRHLNCRSTSEAVQINISHVAFERLHLSPPLPPTTMRSVQINSISLRASCVVR